MAGEVTTHIHALFDNYGKIDSNKLKNIDDPFKNLHLASMSYRDEDVFGKYKINH